MADDHDDDDRDLTPAVRVVPFSEVRLRLVELTAATNSLLHSLHATARQIDSLAGLGRRARCLELADHLAAIGREFAEAAACLRAEAGGAPG